MPMLYLLICDFQFAVFKASLKPRHPSFPEIVLSVSSHILKPLQISHLDRCPTCGYLSSSKFVPPKCTQVYKSHAFYTASASTWYNFQMALLNFLLPWESCSAGKVVCWLCILKTPNGLTILFLSVCWLNCQKRTLVILSLSISLNFPSLSRIIQNNYQHKNLLGKEQWRAVDS